MKYLILLLALAVTGCQHFAADHRAAVLAVGSIEQSAQTIKAELAAVKPHCDAVGAAHIDSANYATTSIQTQIPPIKKNLAEAEAVKAERDRLKADWLSYKQRELILGLKVAFYVWCASCLICVAVMTFLPGTIYATVAKWTLHFLTAFVIYAAGKIVGWMNKKA